MSVGYLDAFTGVTRRKAIQRDWERLKSKKIKFLGFVHSFVSEVRQRDTVLEYDTADKKMIFHMGEFNQVYQNEKDFQELMSQGILKMKDLVYLQLKGNVLDEFTEKHYQILLEGLKKINVVSVDARFNLLEPLDLGRLKKFLQAIADNPHIIALDISQCFLGGLGSTDELEEINENIAKYNAFLEFLENTKDKLKYLDICSSNLNMLTPKNLQKLLGTIQQYQTKLEFLNLGNNAFHALMSKPETKKILIDFISKNETIRNLNLMGVASLSKETFFSLSEALQNNKKAQANQLAVAFDYSPLIPLNAQHLSRRTQEFMQNEPPSSPTHSAAKEEEEGNVGTMAKTVSDKSKRYNKPLNLKAHITGGGRSLGAELAKMLHVSGLKAAINTWSLVHIKRLRTLQRQMFMHAENAASKLPASTHVGVPMPLHHMSVPAIAASKVNPSHTAVVLPFQTSPKIDEDRKNSQDTATAARAKLSPNWCSNAVGAQKINFKSKETGDVEVYDRVGNEKTESEAAFVLDKNDEFIQERLFRAIIINVEEENLGHKIKHLILLASDPMLPPGETQGMPAETLEALFREQPVLRHFETSNSFLEKNININDEAYNRPGIRIFCFRTGDMPSHLVDNLFEFLNKVDIFLAEELKFFKERAGHKKMSDKHDRALGNLKKIKAIIQDKFKKIEIEISHILEQCNLALHELSILHSEHPIDCRYALDFAQFLLSDLSLLTINIAAYHKIKILNIALMGVKLIKEESCFYKEAREMLNSIYDSHHELVVKALDIAMHDLLREKEQKRSIQNKLLSIITDLTASAEIGGSDMPIVQAVSPSRGPSNTEQPGPMLRFSSPGVLPNLSSSTSIGGNAKSVTQSPMTPLPPSSLN